MSRHLIANSQLEYRDSVTVIGWDPSAGTYFCDIERGSGLRVPYVGGGVREVQNADELALILADALIRVPPVLVARLRLEKLAPADAIAPELDWRSGEPTQIS